MNNTLKKVFSVVFSGLCLSFLPFPAYCSGKPKKIDEEKKPYKAVYTDYEYSQTPSGEMELSKTEINKFMINQRKFEDFMAREKEVYSDKENLWIEPGNTRFTTLRMPEWGTKFKRFIFESSTKGREVLKKLSHLLKEPIESDIWIKQVFPLDCEAFKLVITNRENGNELIFYFKFGSVITPTSAKKYDFTEELNKYNDIINCVSNLGVINDYILDRLKIRKHLVESAAVPGKFEEIKYDSFSDFCGMKLVDVLGCISTMDTGAFYGCINLKKINFHEKVESVGPRAFKNCYELEEIHFPEGLLEIGEYAFENCFKLKKITIPSSIETIESNAFLHTPDDLKIVYGNVEYDKNTFLNYAFLDIGVYVFFN